jgi:tRNA A-37 threonylcarbamoyl transferase component Bud32
MLRATTALRPPAPVTHDAGRASRRPLRTVAVQDVTLVASPDVAEPLIAQLRAHGTLYAWAGSQPQPRALRGRGAVFVATLPEVPASLAVRHAWHGGLLAPLTRDRFRVPTRAPREAAVGLALRDAGIETPELLAYALYPAGPGLRRVDVCTRYIAHGWDYGAVLAAHATGIDRDAADAAVLDLLARLARAGIVHPDLNVKNVLLVPDEQGALCGWLLDVDVVRFTDQSARSTMQHNLDRLARSIRKWHRRHELPLAEGWLRQLCAHAVGGLT